MKQERVLARDTGTVALRRPLTPAQFGDLAEIPPELEWLANFTNPKTRRAYKIDVEEFIAFAGSAASASCAPSPVPTHRLAQGPRTPRARPFQYPPQALGALRP